MEWIMLLLLITEVVHSLSDKIEVAVKTSSEKYSDTMEDVFLKVYGTEGDISKTKLETPKFNMSSVNQFTFNDDLGEPIMVTLYKSGNDGWKLEYIKITVGGKVYSFPCDCWMYEYTDIISMTPRPVVSIVTICEHSDRAILCTGNFIINIIDTKYGGRELSTHSEYDIEIRSRCDGMPQCELKYFQEKYGSTPCDRSYAFVVFECVPPVRVAVKTAGVKTYSGTMDDVTIQINGTRGCIMFRENNYKLNSMQQCGFIEDIGEPYLITIHKPGDDMWKLEYIKVAVGRNEYMFHCDCWLSEIAEGDLNEPRPVVHIMTSCQGQNWPIQCPGNYVINIIDANYGRWDKFTCSPTSDSVCMNVDVLETFKIHCNGASQCSIKSLEAAYILSTCMNSYIMVVFKCVTTDGKPERFTTGDQKALRTCHPPTERLGEPDLVTASTHISGTSERNPADTPVSALTTTSSTAIVTPTAPIPKTTAKTADSTNVNNATENKVSSGTNSSFCPCECGSRYYGDTGCSLDDVDCVVSALRKELIVDVESTSSFKRKKTSAYDGRTSSRLIGATGVVFLVTVLLVIIGPDVVDNVKYICSKLNTIQK